jgi:predicted transcriptional regulator YdeE
MKIMTIEPFTIIGISVRTINHEETAAKDIGGLWNKFITEGIASKIPNKIEESIFSIYTNYESDHTKPYDTILGCKVSSLDEIPEGMVGQAFEGGNYTQFIAKGNLTQGVVYNTWNEIWNQDLNREFTADFEVYGEKAMNPEDAEVDIFVAIKN